MTETLTAVREVLIEALELPHSPGDLTAESHLLGSLPELDSMGMLVLVTALEERFGITIEDEEFSADLFMTLGSLTEYVSAKVASS